MAHVETSRMKNPGKDIFRFIIGFALLFLFLSYWASSQLYQHSHVIDNVKVVHSHPFSEENHTHTSADLYTIASLGSLLRLDDASFSLDGVLYTLIASYLVALSTWGISVFRGFTRLFRGPPVCSVA